MFSEWIWHVALYFSNKHFLASLCRRQWNRKCNLSSATSGSNKHPRCPLGAEVPDLSCPLVSYFYLGINSRFSLPLNVFPALCSSGFFILISIWKSAERKWLISQPETHCFHAQRRVSNISFSRRFCFCFFCLRNSATVFELIEGVIRHPCAET